MFGIKRTVAVSDAKKFSFVYGFLASAILKCIGSKQCRKSSTSGYVTLVRATGWELL